MSRFESTQQKPFIRGVVSDPRTIAVVGTLTVVSMLILSSTGIRWAVHQSTPWFLTSPVGESWSSSLPFARTSAPSTVGGRSGTLPFMDRLAMRRAVSSVPAPADTGLPNVQRVGPIYSKNVLAQIHMEVIGVDNPAWMGLSAGERRAYAEDVLRAAKGSLPEDVKDRSEVATYIYAVIWETIDLGHIDGASALGPHEAEEQYGCQSLAAGKCHRAATVARMSLGDEF
ncbi:MAG: hypothetical protein HW416_2258 [Chloroflexi bacterium]|nr:hypothetical protein [Chloroflexota bacterium]